MSLVDFDDEALAEAEEARAFYAAIWPDLGDDFAGALDTAVRRIAAHPMAGPRSATVRDGTCSIGSRIPSSI